MALGSAVKGSKRPSQVVQWLKGDGTPEDLSGATLTGLIRNLATGTVRVIDGSLTILEAGQGKFTWAYGDLDISEAGTFWVQFTATYVSGVSPAKTVQAEWVVSDSLELV